MTLTDNDDPVSFSIADAEADEGGKITFTVSRAGAEDNVASVKIATAADSGEDVNAADADDYTAIATAQTLNFAKGVTSQTVEVQTTQDDLFEPDETFKAVLSAPALADGDPGTGVSLEAGKGTATGTIKNDDTEPSFEVADASAAEGDDITFTVTRKGAADNAVSVKWNTKADSSDGANAASTDDYTAVTTATQLDFAASVTEMTFTVATTEDTLHEGNETFLVELTSPEGGTIDTAEATGTITDDDDAPTGITLSVDTNGATAGTPSTVAEDAGATVVTVTATVNGETRYVDAKTVAVSVADNTAASPADYAAVNNFTITIAAGAASQTGSFTVTPVDDNLDEADETMDVTGTLTDVTITGATVTLTDNDDPVSFSIADAEATEGGKVTFTVSRAGAGDNVASVKIATAADSGEDVNAADADDYTAIATAQTLNFAKGVTIQTVEVQTTDDDLFEPDETFKAVLSAPALAENDPGTGVSIETGKGTATGTIKNDDTEPSFEVADASASEGDAITFTVTRSGAMDNAVSVKWNTKADSSDGANAASTDDYTPVTTATTLTFAKDVGSQTFTVATTEDTLHEGNETFLVELTGAEGGTITTAEATGTINDDDDAPTGITLSVDTNGATEGTPSTVAEDAGATVVTVTATVNGTTRYVDAKTVEVSVADNTAASPADYAAVSNFTITIAAGAASQTGNFTVTPVDDDLDEDNETMDVTGTLTDVTITGATVTLTDTDDPVSFSIADAEATEGGKITFTVSRDGAEDNVASVKIATAADSGEGVNAADADDYTAIATAQTLNFAKGVTSQTVEVQTTQDNLFEPDETFKAVLSVPALAENDPGTGVSIAAGKGTATGTIKNDDAAPTGITLSVSHTAVNEDAGKTQITVTATVNGTTRYVDAKTVTVSVGGGTAISGTDYKAVSNFDITIAAGAASHTGTFDLTPTNDDLDEVNETMDVTGTLTDVTITGATVTLTDTDDPVSFSIADAEATEGGKVTFKVSRAGAEDNVATVKIATAADTGADVNAADADDYTAIATAQTLNFAKGVTSQTVEVQTTQDNLFEPDETFKAVLSAPALAENDPGTGVSIETGKGTATGTIKNDDTEPSFAVKDANATEGNAITFTVTRSGAMDNAVSVKWNTKADSSDGANAASTDDYTPLPTATTLTFAKGISSQTFTVATTEDALHEGNETFLVELTGAVGGTIATAEATGTITDDDTAPTGITLSVSPAAVREDAGATVVTVTATVNGTTRYVDAKTVAVSVTDNTAASPADYAAVSDFNITIAAGAASQTGNFTVTPVDDALDEANETMDVTGTLTDVTITGATVTLTDTDDAVSFSIADAEVAEGGKITFTVTRDGAEDNVASVKIATAADSGEDVNAADADDYTAIATAQTLNFAKGVTSQTVEVQTTQDDLFEPDETFKAVLSAPALAENDPGTGVSIESGKGTATGTIKNDDTEPSFAVADASASEGDAITFTVTRSGAMDNAVSVKWNTKAATGANAASATDYTPVTTATTLTFAKNVGTQTFTVATTEDVLAEENETFLVELTGAVGGTIATAEATGTINDDDDAPTGITLTVSPDTVEEDAGKTKITVTATVNGTTRYVDAKTVTVSVGGGTAISGTDYADVSNFDITIAAGTASHTGTFDLTPTNDDLDEANETIDVTGTSGSLDVTKATVTINDNDDTPSGITLSVSPAAVNEDAGKTKITVTATVNGTTRYVDAKTVTVSVGGGTAISGTDYADVSNFDITIAAGTASHTGTFDLIPTNDDLDEANETIDVTGTSGSLDVTKATVTINDNDETPTVTLALTPTTINESGNDNASTVTATLLGKSDKDVTLTVSAVAGADTAAGDFTLSTNTTLTIAAGATTSTGTVTITAVDNDVDAPNKSVTVSATANGGGVANPDNQTLTIADNEGTPTVTLVLTPTTINESGATNASTVTATLSGKSNEAVTLTVAAAAGADTVAGDFTLSATTTLTIVAGATTSTGTVKITAVDNDVDAPNKSVTVSATASGGEVANPDNQTLTINDDEGTPTVTLVLTPTVIDESGNKNESTVTATLSGTSSEAVTLTVAAAAVSPAAAGDFTLSTNTTLTIAAGSKASTGAVTITAVDNSVDAPNKTVTVSATATGGEVADPDDATLTITDDDAAPTGITLAVDKSTIAENAAEATVTVTASVTGGSTYSASKDLTIAVGAGTSTAVSGEDYTAVGNFTLTLPAGASSAKDTFDLEPLDDDVDEDTETITVTGTDPGGVAVSGASIDLTDDDTKGVTVAGGPLSMAEADKAGTTGTREDQDSYTVVLDSAPTDDVRINITAPAMVTLSPTSLTFTPSNWNQAQTVTATAVDDTIDNAGDARTDSIAHAVVAGSSDYTGVAAASVAVTVNDDDGTPVVTLKLTPTSVEEDGGATSGRSTVTASLSGASHQAVTLTVAAAAVSPAVAGDFSLTGTTLTIAAGSTTSTGTVTITAVDNTVDAPDKTVTVSATASGGGVADPDDQTLTILDDDEAGTELNITVSLGEGNTSTRVAENVQTAPTITVTASLAGEVTSSTARTVNVTVGHPDDSATKVDDYKMVDGFDITIAAEASSGTGSFTFTPVDDAIDENDETVSINGAFAGSTPVKLASITITDNDTRGISVTPVTLTLAEADNPSTQNTTEHQETYSVELDSQPTGTVTVNLASGDTTIATLSDNSLEFTTSDWDAQTVTVTAVADDIDNTGDARTVRITHTVSAASTDYKDETAAAVDVTVTDDDGAPTLSIDSPSVTEGDSGTATLTFKVTLSPASGKPVTVAYADATTGTATSATDYAAITSGALSFAAGQTEKTVDVTVNGDTTDEPNETVILRLSSPSNAALSGGSTTLDGTGTITDDDAAPTVSVADAPAVNEGDAPDTTVNMSFTVTLSAASANAVTVPYTLTGTATGGSDYETPSSTSLSIAAGATSGTIVIKVKGDALDEPNETIIVTLGAPTNATVSTTAGAGTGTITDDDDTPTVTLELDPRTIYEKSGDGQPNTSTVTATLSGKSHAAVTLTVAAAAGANTAAGDFTLTGTTLTIAAGATTSTGTVTITAVDNDRGRAEQDGDGLGHGQRRRGDEPG